MLLYLLYFFRFFYNCFFFLLICNFTFERYLADAIWKSLPEVEKTVLDNQAPVTYDEQTREVLLKSLQYCNWPTKRDDIEEFEREIELGGKYLRLAHELSYYVLGKVETSREKVESVNRELLAAEATTAASLEALVEVSDSQNLIQLLIKYK